MPSRKRSLAVADGEDGENELSLQHRIRNMWQFANLCQWIYIFGKAAKIDEAIDVEVRPYIDESLDFTLLYPSMLTLLAGNRGRMPETKFDYANGYCPGPSQTRIVASWFNVCFRELAGNSVLLTTIGTKSLTIKRASNLRTDRRITTLLVLPTHH